MTTVITALFAPGQIVRHKVYGYRGLVFDVDPQCNKETSWLEKFDLMDPIGTIPWYHVLVDGESHASYVSEDNLEAATGIDGRIEFNHPLLKNYFDKPDTGTMYSRRHIN